MIKTTLIGNLASDAKLCQRKTNVNNSDKDNGSFLSFTIIVNERSKDKQEFKTIVNVTTKNTKLLPYLKTGKKLYVEGRPYVSSFEKDERTIPTFNVLAQLIEFCSPNNKAVGDEPIIVEEPVEDLPF